MAGVGFLKVPSDGAVLGKGWPGKGQRAGWAAQSTPHAKALCVGVATRWMGMPVERARLPWCAGLAWGAGQRLQVAQAWPGRQPENLGVIWPW